MNEPRRWRRATNASRDPAWTCRPASTAVLDFHRSLPGYAPTRLAALPGLAQTFGVARVFAKEESNRFGLPAFKALGASWAIHRALRERAPAGPVTIVTATDGNHGRAVARFARQFGHRAAIFVPDGVPPAAVRAIRDEGATVTHVPGNYDDAVHAAARADIAGGFLVQDMAWDGYEDVPGWIVDGYTTLFAEIDDQLHDQNVARPDLVVVPAGVGSLLQAALTHYRSGEIPPGPAVVSVEPLSAACVLASVTAGRPVTVATATTIMTGLNCGTVSSLAWPYISRGLDACVAVDDADVADAMRELAAHGVDAGACGAASLAALHGIHRSHEPLELTATSTVVLLVTEGASVPTGRISCFDGRVTQDFEQIVTASRDIAAPAEDIFELIADPSRQPHWDGNDNLSEAPAGQRVRAVGDVFLMTTTTGKVRENHVFEFVEGRLIAWRPSEPGKPAPGHLWRWALEPIDASHTRVTHTYDWTRLGDEKRLARARATTADKLQASIDRLAALAER